MAREALEETAPRRGRNAPGITERRAGEAYHGRDAQQEDGTAVHRGGGDGAEGEAAGGSGPCSTAAQTVPATPSAQADSLRARYGLEGVKRTHARVPRA